MTATPGTWTVTCTVGGRDCHDWIGAHPTREAADAHATGSGWDVHPDPEPGGTCPGCRPPKAAPEPTNDTPAEPAPAPLTPAAAATTTEP